MAGVYGGYWVVLRKTVIFGNGLGRALDNAHFSIERGLQTAWEEGLLSVEQKGLIKQCLPEEVLEEDGHHAPHSESELDSLQRVLAACDEIRKYEAQESWLNENGRQFPFAIRSYIHRAASTFLEGGYDLPQAFSVPLIDFLVKTRSHVATLNYDGLLYRAFIGTGVFSGFQCMIDGFNGPFDAENLDRWYPQRQSYYLHLHGSPLFYTHEDGDVTKTELGNLGALYGHASTHLVLTQVDHKVSVINASRVLREYWKRLEEAISESDGILLFGYGGGDRHLNYLLSQLRRERQVEIVERLHPQYLSDEGKGERFEHWSRLLGGEPDGIFWPENILEHGNWDWVRPNHQEIF